MNSIERMKKTLTHETPDRVPIDFGSSAVTGIHCSCVEALRDYYHLEKKPVKVHEPYQMLGMLEDDLLDELCIDVEGICGRNTMFGFPNENWKEFRTPWGQEILVSEHFNTTVDSNGDILIYPEGDLKAPPSGRMPVKGYFFDTIIRQPQVDEENLDPEENLEEFKIISAEDCHYLRSELNRVRNSSRCILGTFGGTAFGDIALVPAPFLKEPKGIRDVAEWYISTKLRQDYIHTVFSKQCEIAIINLKKIHDVVQNGIDIIFICGTDFGTQRSSFCSTSTYDELYAPYYKQVNDWIHKNTNWLTFKHSCGAVENFMPHFIESGFDIINPVQCSASGMDPELLKEKYGSELTFWGGGVDTQNTLPNKHPDDVYNEVQERCRIFSKKGGYVFNSIHNIQANTPIHNIVAMFNAVKDYNNNHQN